ncbi:hypothetical protein SAMN05421823_10884 [Catalinimonas alkaloidigena]|uniref:Uncharacterized protein n=1 Tax=Catalinimonas alkaloidigena TaxID=1075417 RepID=A0A1G9MTK5_9BACT|nr:hypothetical protein [Catalinimonas alkaloidigena]SDL77598.1 hypothetical protein SAMN05421823_10884 [Catalinimonas alkaloidigena]
MLLEARPLTRPLYTATPSMKRVKEVGDTLFWYETSPFRKHFKLKGAQNKDITAFLKWKKECGSLALGETLAGRWTFKRNGFLRPYISIHAVQPPSVPPAASEEMGRIWINTNGEGRFAPVPDREYTWKCTNFWKNEWSWFFKSKRLLKIDTLSNFNNKVGRVTVETDKVDDDMLSLLLLSGWYIMALMQDESGTDQVNPF